MFIIMNTTVYVKISYITFYYLNIIVQIILLLLLIKHEHIMFLLFLNLKISQHLV